MTTDVKAATGGPKYHHLAIDVPDLYRCYPVNKPPRLRYSGQPLALARFYRTRYLPLSIRFALLRFLRQTQADLSWFNEFSAYWSNILGGRPLWGVQDFYFLRGWYRIQFQESEVPNTDDPLVHQAAWQNPELMYFLFQSVYKESVDAGILTQWTALSALRHLNRKPARMLEFGCGIASIARFYYDLFDPLKTVEFIISDVSNLAFHYAACRYADNPRVTAVELKADDGLLLRLDKTVDVIFCLTVFEHLNQPLKTAQIFYEKLNPGGLLIFDYIKSHAEGMDTIQGLQEREQVLAFIQHHFEQIEGVVDTEKSMGLTVVRKR